MDRETNNKLGNENKLVTRKINYVWKYPIMFCNQICQVDEHLALIKRLLITFCHSKFNKSIQLTWIIFGINIFQHLYNTIYGITQAFIIYTPERSIYIKKPITHSHHRNVRTATQTITALRERTSPKSAYDISQDLFIRYRVSFHSIFIFSPRTFSIFGRTKRAPFELIIRRYEPKFIARRYRISLVKIYAYS